MLVWEDWTSTCLHQIIQSCTYVHSRTTQKRSVRRIAKEDWLLPSFISPFQSSSPTHLFCTVDCCANLRGKRWGGKTTSGLSIKRSDATQLPSLVTSWLPALPLNWQNAHWRGSDCLERRKSRVLRRERETTDEWAKNEPDSGQCARKADLAASNPGWLAMNSWLIEEPRA